MDGKLLILCDEAPRDYEYYKVRDAYYLKSEMVDPDDNSQKIFVSWDSIIPTNPAFINGLISYHRTYDEMDPGFILKKCGNVDPAGGNIKTSIQEESYYDTFEADMEYLRSQTNEEDFKALAIDLAVEYPFSAMDRFLGDLSRILNLNGVIRILPTHSSKVDPDIIRRRMMILDAWINKNRLLREKASGAEVLSGLVYDDVGEVLRRSDDELMKIYSLPVFGDVKNKGL